jgi:transcriptional regulator with XRE-family HTH domain
MRNPFAEMIRNRREELQLSREEVAHQVNRSPSWLALVEAGRRRPDLDVVPLLARAIEKDPRAFTEVFLGLHFPAAARVLFDRPVPEVVDQTPAFSDSACRLLEELPDDFRRPIEQLIRSAHDLLHQNQITHGRY